LIAEKEESMSNRIAGIFTSMSGSRYSRLPVWIFAIVWSTIFILVIPVHPGGPPLQQTLTVGIIFVCLCVALLLLYQCCRWYHLSTDSRRSIFITKRKSALILAGCILVLGWYFYLFYPGLISWDFYAQWLQVTGRIPFSDWHPVFHTLLIWLVTRVWFSPAAVSLCQIAAFSLLLLTTLKKLDRAGVAPILIAGTALFYIVYPLNGFYMVSLWKDIAYALSLWWYTLLVIDIILSEGDVTRRLSFLLHFLCATIFLTLTRHNGIVPAFGTLLLILFIYRKYWLGIIGCLTFAILLIFLYRATLLPLLHVDIKEKNILKAHLPIQQIGAILNDNGQLTEKEKTYLNSLCPLDYWKNAFDPHSCMPLIFGKRKDGKNYLDGYRLTKNVEYSKFMNLWWHLALRNPGTVLNYQIQASEFLWKIRNSTGVFIIPDEDITAQHLMKGYSTGSPNLYRRVGPIAKWLIRLITQKRPGWFWHRGAVFFWATMLFVSMSFLFPGKGRQLMLVGCPTMLQALTLVAFPLVQDTRFIYPIILTAPTIIVFFFSRNIENNQKTTKIAPPDDKKMIQSKI
jgi:Family of unknown function (DUF6020)